MTISLGYCNSTPNNDTLIFNVSPPKITSPMLLKVNAKYPVNLAKIKLRGSKSLELNWPHVAMAQESREEARTRMRIIRKLLPCNQGPDGLKSEYSSLICITFCSLNHRKGLFQHPRKALNSNKSFL